MNKTTFLTLLAGWLLATGILTAQTVAEPTNAAEAKAKAEAAAKKAARDVVVAERYQAWVATLPPEQQAWEKVLQENLGGFYLPGHQSDKLAHKSDAWDYVVDNPKLKRVLLIGDSVSRGYTLPARQQLEGKVNLHRAPENCGPTANGLKKLDIWLGEGHWDVIHFNFGIHDRGTPLADYKKRLEQLVVRMQKTGAKLIWASTTPIPDEPTKGYKAASIVEHNQAAEEIMKQYGVAIDPLFEAVTPHLTELQLPHDVHFKPQGYEFLGQEVAKSILSQLAEAKK
jgi:lysophospholipase L1-like esterase